MRHKKRLILPSDSGTTATAQTRLCRYEPFSFPLHLIFSKVFLLFHTNLREPLCVCPSRVVMLTPALLLRDTNQTAYRHGPLPVTGPGDPRPHRGDTSSGSTWPYGFCGAALTSWLIPLFCLSVEEIFLSLALIKSCDQVQ